MKSLSSKTYQCGVTIQGLTTLSGTVYLTGITNTASWDHVIVGTTAQGQIYTRTYAQFMGDVATGISLSSYVTGSGTTNYLPKFTGASALGNSQIFDNGTNVGIGTASPTALLTVAGTTDLAWAASTSKLQISRSSTVARLQNYENGSAATSLALQWEGGNVGIGTTSPAYKLDVEASSGLIETIRIRNGYTGGSDGSQLLLGNSANFTNAYFRLNGGGNSSQAGAGSLNIGLTESSPMAFYTTNTERMRITSGGNLGIGTTSPSQKLDVNGYAKFTSGIILDGGATSHYREFIWNTSGFNRWDLYVYGAEPGSNVGGDLFLARYADNGAYLANTVTFQRSTGNVGIGTTSPGYKLDVIGTLGVTGDTTIGGNIAGARTLNLISSDNAVTYDINFQQYGTGVFGRIRYEEAASDFQFYAKSDTDPNLTLQWGGNSYFQRGNVGIGTTAPAGKLDIWGSNDYNQLWIRATTGNAAINFDVETSASGYYNWRIDAQGLVANAICITPSTAAGGTTFTSPVMTITQGGSVGIGTTSPGYTLEVNGTQRTAGNFYLYNTIVNPATNFSNQRGVGFEASTGKLEIAASASTALAIGRFGGTGQILDFRYAGTQIGNFSLDTNDLTLATARHLILSPTGNVGIGTSSPTAKLHIAMPDVASAANPVTGSGWSEYFWNQSSAPSDATRVLLLDTTSNTASSRVLGIGFAPGYTGHQNWGIYASAITGGSANEGNLHFVSQDNSVTYRDVMTMLANGNVLIGNTTDAGYKLDVNGTIRTQTGYILGANSSADIIIDGSTGSQLRYGNQKVLLNSADAYIYTNNIARLSITNAGIATFSNNLITTNGIADPGYVRITNPEGGISVGNGPITASIKIALPANGSFTNIMLSFTVHIYNYALGTTRTLKIAGYTYYNQDWYNMSVYQSGGELIGNINVRFGVEGGRNCVWIGETNTYWSYPNIFVTDVQCGHSQTANLTSGWTISLVTTLGTVQNTIVAYTNITTKDIGGTTNYVSKFTGANTLGNSLIFDNGTNVGIGTASPGYKLDIQGIVSVGTTAVGGTLRLEGKGGFSYPAQISTTTVSGIKFSDDSLGMNVVFLSSGNVGIGTTSPQERLDVNTNSTGLNVDNTAAIFGNDVGTSQSRDTWIKLRASVATTDLTWAFGANQSGDFRFNYLGTRATAPTSGTTLVTIKNAGNVGIGTTSPSTLLDVSGVITATGGNSTNWNTAYGWGNHASASYVPQARTLTINGTSYDLSANRTWTIATTTAAGSDTQVQYNSSGSLAGASALTYNSTTNRVGINQASPGYDLDVNGQVRVQDKLRVGTGNGVVHMSSTATINASATTVVWAQTVSVGMCAFIEYYILNSTSLTDQRAGTIMVTWNQSGTPTITHTETTTPDIGSTTTVNFTSSLVGSDARINAVNSSANPYTMVMSYKYF